MIINIQNPGTVSRQFRGFCIHGQGREVRYGAGDYAPAQGENELPRRRLMLFQPVPAGQFVFLPPSTIHFMSKKIFVKVRKGRPKNAAGDAFFDLPFLFPLTKNELQGQFFLLLTKRIAPRAGKRKNPVLALQQQYRAAG